MNRDTIIILLEEEKSKTRKNKSEKAKQGIRNAYKRAIRLIKDTYPNDSKVTPADIRAIDDLTDHMKRKIINWIVSGKIPKPLSREQQLRESLIHIMGIGKSTAKKLMEKGLTSINQLKSKKWSNEISSATRLHLSLTPNERIKRRIIECFEKKLQKVFPSNQEHKWYIVGSYRRGEKYSSDIDLLIISTSEPLDLFESLKEALKIIASEDGVIGYAGGSKRMNLLVDLKSCGLLEENKSTSTPVSTYAKVDIFLAKPENEFPMLVYSTGPADTMIKLRSKLKKGIKDETGVIKKYKLNQFNLWDITDELDPKPIDVQNEHQLFDLADMPYVMD
jgi:DNA polymerase/3'-5' exonuclease PolX